MDTIISSLQWLLQQGKGKEAAAIILPTLMELSTEQKLELLAQVDALARHPDSLASAETQEHFRGYLLLGCGFEDEGEKSLKEAALLRHTREKAQVQGLNLDSREELYRLVGSLDFENYARGRPHSSRARLLLDENTVAYLVMAQQMEKLLPVLRAFPGASWLTVGDGRHAFEARFIKKHQGNPLPTNLDTTLLKEAKEQGYIDDYRQENVERLSFADKSFDFVCCKETLHHLLQPYLGLYEMLRVAREGIFLLEPFDHSFQGSALLGTRAQHPFHPFEEGCGNYVYTMSERELEKLAVSQNIPFLAFRGISIIEENGIPNDSREERDLRRQRARVERLDAQCRKGQKLWESMATLMLKRLPSPTLREELKAQGFTLLDLPCNPHLERAALRLLHTHYQLENQG